MEIKNIDCDSWHDFKSKIFLDLFNDGKFEKEKYLFRGQGDENWPLATSFDRWFLANGFNIKEKYNLEEELLDRFIKECELEDLPQNVIDNKERLRSLAQHHGLPTRLLDWSESIYVASFFAFSGHLRNWDLKNYDSSLKKVAIWVLNLSSHVWNEKNGCGIINVPSFGNERIKNQFGKFTYLTGAHNSIENYVSHFDDTEALMKYTIPVKDVSIAIADLDSMGINYARIYPGLSGNAKTAEIRTVLKQINK